MSQYVYVGFGVKTTKDELKNVLGVDTLEDHPQIDDIPRFIEDIHLENEDDVFVGCLLKDADEGESIEPITLEPSRVDETIQGLQGLGFNSLPSLYMMSVVG